MDTIANLLTSIRNAEMASHTETTVPATKHSKDVAGILVQEGYLKAVTVQPATPQDRLVLTLQSGRHSLRRISKPGRRVYTDAKSIPTVRQGTGIVIISTSKGVLSGKEARKQKVGGEIICEVY